jgi:excisionase family DNA binding protein
MEKEYTIQELASLLEIDPKGVHGFLVENKIPFIKMGRNYLISNWDLEKKKSIRRKRDNDS